MSEDGQVVRSDREWSDREWSDAILRQEIRDSIAASLVWDENLSGIDVAQVRFAAERAAGAAMATLGDVVAVAVELGSDYLAVGVNGEPYERLIERLRGLVDRARIAVRLDIEF